MDIAASLAAAGADGDGAALAAALGTVARARLASEELRLPGGVMGDASLTHSTSAN